MPKDSQLLPKNQRRAVIERCDQVPVLEFNCGRYDLNLTKEHFSELLADTAGKVQVAGNLHDSVYEDKPLSASLTFSTIWAQVLAMKLG